MSAATGAVNVRRIAMLVAILWSAALPIAGFTVPMYSEEVQTSSGAVSRTDTLAGANGAAVVIVLLIPLLVSVFVAAALMAPGPRGGLPIAWALTAALCVMTVLAMLSIGVFLLPAAIALVVACAAETHSSP